MFKSVGLPLKFNIFSQNFYRIHLTTNGTYLGGERLKFKTFYFKWHPTIQVALLNDRRCHCCAHTNCSAAKGNKGAVDTPLSVAVAIRPLYPPIPRCHAWRINTRHNYRYIHVHLYSHHSPASPIYPSIFTIHCETVCRFPFQYSVVNWIDLTPFGGNFAT